MCKDSDVQGLAPGQRFLDESTEFGHHVWLVARVSSTQSDADYTLINVKTGTRFCDPTTLTELAEEMRMTRVATFVRRKK